MRLTPGMALRPVGRGALALVAALGLIWALGAGAPAAGASDGASAAAFGAPCGLGFPKTPPKRYRFHVWGTSGYRFFGTETYSYRGVMKRVICRGTKVEYWQTRGTGTLKFNNIDMGEPFECNYMGPPYTTVANGSGSFPLRRFDLDVGFGWSGDRYDFTARADKNYRNTVNVIVTCANGVTFPAELSHYWIGDIFRKGRPRRIVKGHFEYQDIEFYKYKINWRLRAPRPLRPAPTP
jgi:hypothetical protein